MRGGTARSSTHSGCGPRQTAPRRWQPAPWRGRHRSGPRTRTSCGADAGRRPRLIALAANTLASSVISVTGEGEILASAPGRCSSPPAPTPWPGRGCRPRQRIVPARSIASMAPCALQRARIVGDRRRHRHGREPEGPGHSRCRCAPPRGTGRCPARQASAWPLAMDLPLHARQVRMSTLTRPPAGAQMPAGIRTARRRGRGSAPRRSSSHSSRRPRANAGSTSYLGHSLLLSCLNGLTEDGLPWSGHRPARRRGPRGSQVVEGVVAEVGPVTAASCSPVRPGRAPGRRACR